jgi:predicted DNA-binding transcriptional regulator AlpA
MSLETEMNRLLDERAAAQLLSCSPALLRKWRRLGGGPRYCKIGSLVRYSEADLTAFIEQSRVEAA